MTAEIMTMSEIEEQFDNEWVLVEDPELDRNNKVVRGRVLVHSKNRNDIDAVAIRLRPKRSAFLYTGPPPDNILINI